MTLTVSVPSKSVRLQRTSKVLRTNTTVRHRKTSLFIKTIRWILRSLLKISKLANLFLMGLMIGYKSMWDEQMGQITVSQHPVVQNPLYPPFVHSAPCQAGPRHGERGAQGSLQYTKSRWGRSHSGRVSFDNRNRAKNSRCLRFCVSYHCLVAITKCDCYYNPKLDKCVCSLHDA